MIEHSKHNEFTAQDIERYHSGKMSSLEMHELEKAAMEDPFLADALEGYAYTTSPAEDNKYLQNQIHSKLEAGRIVEIKRPAKNQFLRIAALFILLAGCGWAVYQFGFNTTSNDIAATKKPNLSTTPPAAADSNVSEPDLQFSTANTDSNKQTTTIQNDGRGTVSISTQNRHTGKLNSKSVSKEKAETGNLAQDEANLADQQSAVPSSLKKEAGYVNPIDNDSIYEYTASAPQTVSPGKENVIVMQRNKTAPIPEVVLSNKKRDSTYRKPHITFEEAEPATGAVYYNDYVANNLQMPEKELQKNISGEVKLSFDVDDAGQAVNIKVEKSLCTECDKEAIRILKQGPKWVKKKKDKKGKLSIQF